MSTGTKIFRKVSFQEFEELLDWAENANVDWEVWDYDVLTNPEHHINDTIEIWLEEWPW